MYKGMMKNPDTIFVKNQAKRIKQNSGFCPCKLERIPENKCPCKDYRELGDCCCGLYVKDISSMAEEMFG